MKNFSLAVVLLLIVSGSSSTQEWKDKPYKKPLSSLSKSYFLQADTGWQGCYRICDKKTKSAINWNMEDLTRIKQIIMKDLPFEPEKSYEPTYRNTFYSWSASKYDLQIMGKDDSQITIFANLIRE